MDTNYIKLEEKPLPQFQERTTAESILLILLQY